MMRIIGSVVAVALCILVIVGCQPEQQVAPTVPPPPPVPQGPQISTEQQQLLEEVQKYTEQTGITLEELVEEAKRREALAQVPTGVAAVDEDLGVAKALVAAARSGAANKQAEKTTAALGRMKPTLRTLRAEVPAAVMAQHLERALVAISSLPASEAVKAASSSLLAAIDIAMQAPAPLVPEVVDRIKAAKDKVDAEQLQPAADQILEILADLRDDATGKLLDSASGSMRGAQDALCREAWPVLIAELDQLEAILSQLQEKVGQETTVIAGEQEPTVTEGARVAGGEEKPAAEPAAETTTGAPEAPEARPPAPE